MSPRVQRDLCAHVSGHVGLSECTHGRPRAKAGFANGFSCLHAAWVKDLATESKTTKGQANPTATPPDPQGAFAEKTLGAAEEEKKRSVGYPWGRWVNRPHFSALMKGTYPWLCFSLVSGDYCRGQTVECENKKGLSRTLSLVLSFWPKFPQLEPRSPDTLSGALPSTHMWKAVQTVFGRKKEWDCWSSAGNHYVIQLEFDLYPPNEAEPERGGNRWRNC